MPKFIKPAMVAVFLLASAFFLIGVARGQGNGPQVVQHETQNGNVREITAPPDMNAPQQPNIGFIDSPSATCSQLVLPVGQCFPQLYDHHDAQFERLRADSAHSGLLPDFDVCAV